MDTSDVCARPRTMCALVTASGSHGRFSLHVWVDLITSPSGRLMMSGFTAGWISKTCAPGRTKCHVAPVSAMALSIAILILEVLNIVSACADFSRSSFAIVWDHALLLVGKVGTVKVLVGSSCTSNVACVAFASNLAFVVVAGALILKNVCLGWLSNGESFVSSADVASPHEVLLMMTVLSSSSSSTRLL